MIQLKEGFFEEQLQVRYKITPEQISQAQKLNAKNRTGLLTNLQQMGVISEKQMIEVQVELFGTNLLQLKNHPLKKDVVELIPEDLRGRHQMVPVTLVGNILTVATASIFQAQQALPEIQKHSNHFIHFVLAFPSEINKRLLEYSKTEANMDEMLENRAQELTATSDGDVKRAAEDPHGPVAKVIEFLVNQAVTSGASDMHFEPLQSYYRVRFRQDGMLREVKKFDKVFTAPFAAAVKIMAKLDIAESRMPQDGTFRQQIGNRMVDFRVATYPTEQGEKIVVRVLDSGKSTVSIDNLMLNASQKKKLLTMIENPFGLIVVAGPTGSGKSTTLYSILAHLNNPNVNILTIEDPIEYRMGGISQAQVNTKKGFTFASALRAMLRLDPNVILVGEMRDLETASIGMQAALTGHLVLSTVHSNTSCQTIQRFTDLGVEPFTVAGALVGVIAQRLIRRVCEQCKELYKPTVDEMKYVGFREPFPEQLTRGKGCSNCHNDGHRGRVPIQELLMIDDELKPIVQKGSNASYMFVEARKRGLQSLRDSALERAIAGMTTIKEILRVLGPDMGGDSGGGGH